MKFISTLWGSRRPPSPSVQERVAQHTVRPHGDVRATPVKPPVRENSRA